MSYHLGINVVETDGTAAPAVAAAPTSVAGLLLRARRGPSGQAVRISSLRQFADVFGAHAAGLTGAYGADAFFANGGREAWVARIAGTGAAAAQVDLTDWAGAGTLRVTAGARGSAEPGAWGNDLYLEVRRNPEFSTRLAADLAGDQPARLQGDPPTGPLDLRPVAGATPRRLVLEVGSAGQRYSIEFGADNLPVPAKATAEDIAGAIATVAGRDLVASATAGGILLVTRDKGATAKIVAVDGADDDTRGLLGFGATKQAAGAAGVNAYTEVRVEGLNGLAPGQWARLDDGLSRDWVRIAGLETRDAGDGTVQSWVLLTAPPAAERNGYRRADGATLATTEFDLVVRRDTGGPQPEAVETWEKLSLDAAHPGYAPPRINDRFGGSGQIVMTDLTPATYTGRNAPADVTGIRLGAPTPDTAGLTRVLGTDGSDPATTQYTAALSLFDTVGIQLLAVLDDMPAGMLTAVTRAAVDYCAIKGDCMFVGHTPSGQDMEGAKAFGQGFRAAKVYGALYWPWITVTDPLGAGPNPTRAVPPTGAVLGVYARTEQARGVWKAPAGQDAVLRGALDVERDVTDADHTDLVRNGSVNGIRRLPGAGIVVDASRTLSTDPRWLYVGVRLLFNFVKASLRDGLRWVKQEPNRQDLWNMIKYGSVTPFLLRLHQRQAFGSGTPAEVFTVICGPENNPPDEVMLGNLQIEVYFYPSRPAETIVIAIGQQESRATAAEG